MLFISYFQVPAILPDEDFSYYYEGVDFDYTYQLPNSEDDAEVTEGNEDSPYNSVHKSHGTTGIEMSPVSPVR